MQQLQPLLSIVIPVYNVEKYIGKCLESCLNQDLDDNNYEIIVVNDGTPDNSMNIVADYQLKRSNIRIIERQNGGLSAARNTGLNAARGEYIWFVDSDDTIEENCLGSLVKTAGEKKLDVLCFGLNLVYSDNHTDIFTIPHEASGKVYDGKQFICRVNMPGSGCVALFRKEFLINNDLKFMEGILHEDQEFTPRAYSLAKRISFVDRPVYFYYQREGSIMKSIRDVKRCRDLLTVADSLYSFAVQHLEPHTPEYDVILHKVYFCVTQSLTFYSRKAFPRSTYRSKPYFPMKYSGESRGMRYKLLLANLSPSLYIMLNHTIRRCRYKF